ncbi:MAG: ATP-binding protein [Roseovarius confluentis]|jgi:uncharacterized protein (TIGR00290 family)
MTRKAVLSWSSGKDAAMALHVARTQGALDIVALVSNFSAADDRVKTHGSQRDIVRAQAAALDLPLVEIDLPDPAPNDAFMTLTGNVATQFADEGVTDWVFGDLFLQDIRDWRTAQMATLGVSCHYPIWGHDTARLAQDMLAAGLEAFVVAADTSRLPTTLCGARFDAAFLSALPDTVDPCGENGEFHTLVANAPGFAAPLSLERGATIQRDGMAYTDYRLLRG